MKINKIIPDIDMDVEDNYKCKNIENLHLNDKIQKWILYIKALLDLSKVAFILFH